MAGKIISFTMGICLFLSGCVLPVNAAAETSTDSNTSSAVSGGAISGTASDSAISAGMDFTGEKIELSIEQAIETAKANSFAGKTAEWNKRLAMAVYNENMENAEIVGQARKARFLSFDAADAYGVSLSTIPLIQDQEMLVMAADFAAKQKDRNYTAEINTLRENVIDTYFKIVNLNDLVKINADNVATREKLYKNTLKKFELGMVARQDVLSSEYELYNARTTYEESVKNLKTAKMGLNMLLGYDIMQEVVLKDTISENATIGDITLADAIKKALAARNEIYAADFAADLQALGMEKVKIKYPASSSTYMKQKVAYERSLTQADLAVKNVEMDVRNKYIDVMQKKNAVETDKKAVEAAQEALRLTQLSYDAGMAIITDVQAVQTKLFQAKLQLSSDILAYNLAVDAFNESLGAGRYVVSLTGETD